MLKIIADDKIPFLRGVLEDFAEVIYLPGKEISREDVKDADALLIRTRTKCDRNLLDASKVKFIATATIGFDHIDTDYCEQNNIIWQTAPGCNANSVVQYILSAMVEASLSLEIDFRDLTLGIVGVGNVGSRLAKKAKALGMKVLLNDPPRARKEGSEAFVDLNYLVEHSDIISFHTPLTREGEDKTFHLVDDSFFYKINEPKIVFNSSRGEVVETQALKRAIKSDKLKFVAIDVWENEPELDRELLQMVNIATPHIAGYSSDGKALGTAMSVQGLSKFFKLSLNNWYPENLPEAENSCIDISEENEKEALFKALLTSYCIKDDHKNLVSNPDKFEYLRGNYPVRREYEAFTMNETHPALERIGFRKK
jgi:erythronate-4-phosphate dehydrogenase